MGKQTTALVKRTASCPTPANQVIEISEHIDPTARQNLQFISKSALKLGLHITAGSGAGKSRFIGRILAWNQLIHGEPAVIFDPTGGVIDQLFDKILRLPPEDQAPLWQRIQYINAGAKARLFPSQLYYDNSQQDTFFEIANRFPAVLKRQDKNLQQAPILGWNSLYECLIYAGEIAAASRRQLDFVADLIEHPSKYKGLLREVLADYPKLHPAVEYFRALMDPSSSSLREKKTGSAKNKLLPFLADPNRMATYAAKTNLLDWTKLLRKQKIIVIDYREQLDPDYLQFDLIWHLKTFMDAIKQRGMAGRGHEVMLILDEITAMLGQQTQDGHAILAEDLQELISRLGRNYGVNTVIAHQGLYQVDERIQNVLMSMGNQIIGQLSSPDDAVRVARQFMRYDPYKVKKTENVWHTIHPPAILSFFGGPEHPYPRMIDQRTIEFTPDEQLLDWISKLSDLDRYQFYVQIATGEGGKKGPAKKITITNLDKNQHPNEALLAPLRQALAKRDGIPLEKLLAEIQANRIEVLLEKKQKSMRQPTKEPATMKGNHDARPTQSTQSISHSGTPSDDSALSADGMSRSSTGDFWEPKTTTEKDSTNTTR